MSLRTSAQSAEPEAQTGVPSASDGISLAAAVSLKIARSSATRSCLRVADIAAKAAT